MFRFPVLSGCLVNGLLHTVIYKVMKDKLKKALAVRTKITLEHRDRIPAAVLIPLYKSCRKDHIVFIKRTGLVSTHKGQYSFPGGARDLTDDSFLETALRESNEEIGLRPEDVEILGEMDDEVTTTSNYMVTPFVGFIPWPYVFTLNEWEVESVLTVPLDYLLDEACLTLDTEELEGGTIPSYSYDYNGHIIWGATARILHKLLDIIKGLPA